MSHSTREGVETGAGDGVSFDHHDPAFIDDPAPAYLKLHAGCPVLRSTDYGGFWLLHRAEDVRTVAKDWRRFTSAVPDVTAIPSSHPRDEPDLPIEIDPPGHTRYRQLVSSVFTRYRVEELRPGIQAIATGLLDELLREGRGDLVPEFAVPLSVGTLALLIGIPEADSGLWTGWVRRMYDSAETREREQAAQEYFAYIDELVASRRPDPDAGFIPMLLAAEVDGERLDAGEVARFLRILLIAGHETTASAMSWTLHRLAEHPDERRRLAQNPQLVPGAVEEFLRLASPVVLAVRNATADLDLHGSRIGEGDVVALALAGANLDADAFPDPVQCVLDRTDNRHLAFGFGPHICLGAHVARLELTVMLEEVGKRVERLRISGPTRRNPSGSVRSFAALPVEIG